MEARNIHGAIVVFLLLQVAGLCNSLSLSTKSRFIVNSQTGKRVKLTCVNWVSHLQPMVAEGLERKPLSFLARKIAASGFNCVRFTWPTYMFTRYQYGYLTVAESLDGLGLLDAKAGMALNNPQFMNMTVINVHKAVVNELSKNKIMVVLDNHVSLPKWCCADEDHNGFFGDEYFDPKEWLQGLRTVAKTYRDYPWVVAMSMRNELRGDRQNVMEWFHQVQQGAKAIHLENPKVLVIISGLDYDKNLAMLKDMPLWPNFHHKLVFEAHWYSFDLTKEWAAQPNKICKNETKRFHDNCVFVMDGGKYPLVVSEFGIDQRSANIADNRYISCFLAIAAQHDFDWALWAFQGSYMIRKRTLNLDEVYGVMDFNWNNVRNPSFLDRLQYIRQTNQVNAPKNKGYWVMYHPHTGLCVNLRENNKLVTGSCQNATRWDSISSKADGPIKLLGRNQCLTLSGDGAAVKITSDCSSSSSKWKHASASGFHLAAKNGDGKYLCMDVDATDGIVSRKCICVDDNLDDLSTCDSNPEVQWFTFVPANA